ncbi:hypothetical protein ACFQU2_10505 [Siccirubricoccus deserti]
MVAPRMAPDASPGSAARTVLVAGFDGDTPGLASAAPSLATAAAVPPGAM